MPRRVVDGWGWGWGLPTRKGSGGSDVRVSSMCCGVGMCVGVGIFCYGCLVGTKRVGGPSRLFIFWINFDCAIVLSPG